MWRSHWAQEKQLDPVQKCLLQEKQRAQHSDSVSPWAEKCRTNSTDQGQRLRAQPWVNDLGCWTWADPKFRNQALQHWAPPWAAEWCLHRAQLPLPQTLLCQFCFIGQNPFVGEIPVPWEDAELSMARGSFGFEPHSAGQELRAALGWLLLEWPHTAMAGVWRFAQTFQKPFRQWCFGLLFLSQWNSLGTDSRDTEAARGKWAVTLLEAHLLLF